MMPGSLGDSPAVRPCSRSGDAACGRAPGAGAAAPRNLKNQEGRIEANLVEVRPCPVRIPHACLRRPMEIFKSFWLIGTHKRWLGGIAPYPVRVLFRERALSHYLQGPVQFILL